MATAPQHPTTSCMRTATLGNHQTLEELNREAINSLQLSRFDEALEVFWGITDCLEHQWEMDEDTRAYYPLRDNKFDPLEPMFGLKLSETEEVHSLSPDAAVDLYNYAFLLPSGVIYRQGLSSALRAETAGILYFNLALVYHRKALSQGGSAYLLEAALQLYKTSSLVLRSTEGLALRTVHLSLAIATNMCHINSFLWRIDELDRSWWEGATIISFLSASNLSDCCIYHEEFVFFCSNFALPRTQLSPAA